MNEYKKYQHIERFGSPETEGIDIGLCHIFPKIDGTNASVWYENGVVKAGSRNRELTADKDNHGFFEYVNNNNKLRLFLQYHPDWRLYGEWLVPHTLKTYRDSAWYKFYIFDVIENDQYLSYEDYAEELFTHGIDVIPPLRIIDTPSLERLQLILEQNTYLIKDGYGAGEGIVIKNYNYVNKYGRKTWAKIVRNEFKDSHWGKQPIEQKDKETIEKRIVAKYVTETLVSKEFAKMQDEWTGKLIPKLLNTVYYCLVKEEVWSFVKEHKNPTIDFKRLMNLTYAKVKQLKPELF